MTTPFSREPLMFAEWFTATAPRLNKLWAVVNAAFDPKLDMAAQYIDLSDSLEQVKGEVLGYQQQALEYWQEYLAERTAVLAEDEPKTKKKTHLDRAKNESSEEKRVYELIVAMNDTIDFRGSQIQSKLKFFKGA